MHENIKSPCALDNINNNNTFEGMTTEDWTRFLNLPTDGSMSSIRKEREREGEGEMIKEGGVFFFITWINDFFRLTKSH